MTPGDVGAIQRSAVRPVSGSVSPPASDFDRLDEAKKKARFVAVMREKYGNDPQITETELQRKIEMLWRGLPPLMRMKMLGSPTAEPQKENIAGSLKKSEKRPSPLPIRRTPKVIVPRTVPKSVLPPVLERRNNCRAIAKALDLTSGEQSTSSGRTVPYSQTVRNRMLDYRSAAQLLASRTTQVDQLNFRPPHSIPSSSTPERMDDLFRMSPPITAAPVSVNVAPPTSTPKTAVTKSRPPVLNQSLRRSRATAAKAAENTQFLSENAVKLPEKMPKFAENFSTRESKPKMTFKEASNQYYEVLSQCLLLYPIDTDSIEKLGDWMEGRQAVQQFTSLEHL